MKQTSRQRSRQKKTCVFPARNRRIEHTQLGTTIIEYVLIAAIISIAATLVLTSIGQQTSNMMAPATNALDKS